MTRDLTDKVVIVTGAHGGQGDAEARLAASRGAHVIAADVSESASGPLAVAEGGDGRGGVHRVHLDVASEESWAQVVAETVAAFGRVDGLVNNAGIALRARLEEVRVDDWERVHRVNVIGSLLGIQAVLPHMPRGGSIVNVGSISALTGFHNIAYTSSKWAVRGLTRSASAELGPRGIRVNAVHPGFIETPMTQASPAPFREANRLQVPLGRVGVPDDVAEVVTFLLSDAAGYLSGLDVPVDGGQTSQNGALALARAVFEEEQG